MNLGLQSGGVLALQTGGGLLLNDGSPVVDYSGDVSTLDTAPLLALAEFVAGVTTEEIAPNTALEEWPQ